MPNSPDRPEQTRHQIDQMLKDASRRVQSVDEVKTCRQSEAWPFASSLDRPCGFRDYLLYFHGSPVGVVEAKKEVPPSHATGSGPTIFAKDNSHADHIVQVVHDEFGEPTTSLRKSPMLRKTSL